MKHTPLADLHAVATVTAAPARPLTRVERLNRWADRLEQRGNEELRTLIGTEHERPAVRALMSAPNSALSVAFADPVLRADGLQGETYGDARSYFKMNNWQLHELICGCHYGRTSSAADTARRVRRLAAERRWSLMAWARHVFVS